MRREQSDLVRNCFSPRHVVDVHLLVERQLQFLVVQRDGGTDANRVVREEFFLVVEERRVPTPFTFADREHYLQAVLGTGPGQGVLRHVDEETVTVALLEAGDPYVQADGAYCFENEFRIVAATPVEA